MRTCHGVGEMARGLRALAALSEESVRFPALTWWLTTTCHLCSMESEACFCPQWALHLFGILTYRQILIYIKVSKSLREVAWGRRVYFGLQFGKGTVITAGKTWQGGCECSMSFRWMLLQSLGEQGEVGACSARSSVPSFPPPCLGWVLPHQLNLPGDNI